MSYFGYSPPGAGSSENVLWSPPLDEAKKPRRGWPLVLKRFRTSKHKHIHAGEGLVWISVWPAENTLAEHFKHILGNLLVPKLLRSDQVSLVWNIQNTRPNARGGNSQNGFRAFNGGPRALLARYENLDAAATSVALSRFSNEGRPMSSRSGRVINEVFGTEIRTYELVQRYEGRHGTKARGTSLVAVWIEPSQGQEEDIDEWYEREHLSMIAATPMFLRSTRYKLRENLVRGSNDDAPRMLTIHECKSTQALLEYASSHGAIVPESPWSRRIFDNVISVERQIWELKGRHLRIDGTFDKKLERL